MTPATYAFAGRVKGVDGAGRSGTSVMGWDW